MPRLAASAALLLLALPAHAQVKAGPEIVVNTFTTGIQENPSVAVTRDGRFVVAWDSPQDGSLDAVMARRFDAAGTRLGGEIRVNTYTTGFQDRPHVAVGRDGRFLVTWQSLNQDGHRLGIYGQRYAADGAPLGGEFRVSNATLGDQYGPNAAFLPSGFVVTWSTYAPSGDGSGAAVMARRFDAAGNALGPEFVVNTTVAGYQNFGYVAATPSGGFIVVWSSDTGGSGWDVVGQRFDAAGGRLGGEFRVNGTLSGNQYGYPLAVAADGRFVAVWSGPDGGYLGAFAQRFDANGGRLGAELLVTTYTTTNQVIASVAGDDAGNFVVAWTDANTDGSAYAIRARRFDAQGVARGAEFIVNTYTTQVQNDSWVSADAVGNFVAVWESPLQDGSGNTVVAQRFGGLYARALAVDAAGNRVLEPGESVGVAPAWENLQGTDQSFTGQLGPLTGPPGATYATVDGTGSYGSVPNGALRACTDCYAVSVSDPSPRPAAHWDAQAVERILPDAQGQHAVWRLHVGRSFADVDTASGFYRFIETLFHHGVTGGCAPGSYCPASATSREQMAVFVLVAREGAGYAPPACAPPNIFDDVPETSPFCRWIEELSRRGVVGGCGGNNYCPGDAVNREQMAVFVLRTLDPNLDPPACAPPNLFDDVPETSVFCRWIEELANRQIVTGCGGGNYCPGSPVTREQMGVFISATFGLTLYGP